MEKAFFPYLYDSDSLNIINPHIYYKYYFVLGAQGHISNVSGEYSQGYSILLMNGYYNIGLKFLRYSIGSTLYNQNFEVLSDSSRHFASELLLITDGPFDFQFGFNQNVLSINKKIFQLDAFLPKSTSLSPFKMDDLYPIFLNYERIYNNYVLGISCGIRIPL